MKLYGIAGLWIAIFLALGVMFIVTHFILNDPEVYPVLVVVGFTTGLAVSIRVLLEDDKPKEAT